MSQSNPEPGAMSDAERLARAVLLFYGTGWSETDGRDWQALTGSREASTRSLCDLARRVRANAVAAAR